MVFKKSSGGFGSASNSRMNFASSSDFMIVILPMRVNLFNVTVQILNEKNKCEEHDGFHNKHQTAFSDKLDDNKCVRQQPSSQF